MQLVYYWWWRFVRSSNFSPSQPRHRKFLKRYRYITGVFRDPLLQKWCICCEFVILSLAPKKKSSRYYRGRHFIRRLENNFVSWKHYCKQQLQHLNLTTISVSECKNRHSILLIGDSHVCTFTKIGEGTSTYLRWFRWSFNIPWLFCPLQGVSSWRSPDS